MCDYPGDQKPSLPKKPEWLKIKLPNTDHYAQLKSKLRKYHLHTICESGNCPNQGECWAAGTATFMILGNTCTRNCLFCNVNHGKPEPPEPEEAIRVAMAVQELGIRHCVLTSVTRDDLKDEGAGLWAATIRAVKDQVPGVSIEALIPDFHARPELIMMVAESGPEVISHNLETVRRLSPEIRPAADYDRSLQVLTILSESGYRAKTGLMAGLGETDEEINESIEDIYRTGTRILTIGQYLRPGKENLPPDRYVEPLQFNRYRQYAIDLGFKHVESAPLVRSSYHAEKHISPS